MLHLGNVLLAEAGNNGSKVANDSLPVLRSAAAFLGTDPKALERAITYRHISSGMQFPVWPHHRAIAGLERGAVASALLDALLTASPPQSSTSDETWRCLCFLGFKSLLLL